MTQFYYIRMEDVLWILPTKYVIVFSDLDHQPREKTTKFVICAQRQGDDFVPNI